MGRLKESECDLALEKGVSLPVVYRKLKEMKGPGPNTSPVTHNHLKISKPLKIAQAGKSLRVQG